MTQIAAPSASRAKSAAPPSSFVALMYHNIAPDGVRRERYSDLSAAVTSYFINRAAFAVQLDEIAALGSHCMTLESLRGFYASPAKTDSPLPAVLLTFDDGWADVFTEAADLLRERRMQAVVFVTTGFLTRKHCISRSGLARVDQQLFRIGSHAVSHRMLCLMEEKQIREELTESKKILEDATGREVDCISIPNGAVDARVRRIAQETGYRFVFDSEVRLNRTGSSPLEIGRVSIKDYTSIDTFRQYIRGQFSRERIRRAVLQAPKRLLGLRRYDRLRRRLLGESGGGEVA